MKEMATHSWTRLQNGTGEPGMLHTVHWVSRHSGAHMLAGPIFPLRLLQRIENQGSENTRTGWLPRCGAGMSEVRGPWSLPCLGGAKAKHAT